MRRPTFTTLCDVINYELNSDLSDHTETSRPSAYYDVISRTILTVVDSTPAQEEDVQRDRYKSVDLGPATINYTTEFLSTDKLLDHYEN